MVSGAGSNPRIYVYATASAVSDPSSAVKTRDGGKQTDEHNPPIR